MSDTSITVPPAAGSAGYPPLLVQHCRGIRRWMRLRAVFINVPYSLAAVSLLIMVSRGVFSNNLYVFPLGDVLLVVAAWLVTAGLYAPAVIHLRRSSMHFEAFIAAPATEHLEKALGCQKAFWKYHGIFCAVMIVPLSIVLLVIVGLAGPWA